MYPNRPFLKVDKSASFHADSIFGINILLFVLCKLRKSESAVNQIDKYTKDIKIRQPSAQSEKTTHILVKFIILTSEKRTISGPGLRHRGKR